VNGPPSTVTLFPIGGLTVTLPQRESARSFDDDRLSHLVRLVRWYG
jgi:hypothetical protein